MPETRRGPGLRTPGTRHIIRNHGHGESTPAQREVEDRVHSAAVVLAAVDAGTWPATVEVIGGVCAVLEAASRWAAVVELAAVA